jgi:hypothetical protein
MSDLAIVRSVQCEPLAALRCNACRGTTLVRADAISLAGYAGITVVG